MAESQPTPTPSPGKWAKYNRRKREKRMAAGLCDRCGGVRDDDRPTCTRCRQQILECGRKARARKEAARLAEFGPKPPPVSADMKAYKRAWRARHMAAGLCTSCGAARDVEGKLRCRACLDADNASIRRRKNTPTYIAQAARDSRKHCLQRQERIANGVCGTCGKAPPVERRKDCEVCAAKHRAKTMARIRRLRATGRCIHCGSHDTAGRSLCQGCLCKTNVRSWQRRVCAGVNGGSLTTAQWEAIKDAHDFRCLRCWRREPRISLTIDHVIPVSRGGSNGPENVQPLCRECNSAKATRDTDYRT